MLRPFRPCATLLLLCATLLGAAEQAAKPDFSAVRGFDPLSWGAAGYPAVGLAANGNPILETGSGTFQLHRIHLQLGNLRPDDLAPLLAAHPQIPADRAFELRFNPLLGTYLMEEGTILWTQGTLQTEEVAAPPDRLEQAMVAAAKDLEQALPTLLDSDLAIKAVRLGLQALVDNRISELGDELDGPFARHLIANGWLEQILGTDPRVIALSTAVAAVEHMRATQRYSGDGWAFATLANGFDRKGYLLEGPDTRQLMLPAAQPMYHSTAAQRFRLTWVVLELAAGTPVLGPELTAGLVAAHHYLRHERVVSWHRDTGFTADQRLWRSLAPEPGGSFARDYLPPHIAVQDLTGDYHALIVAGGVLNAPAASVTDHERFLTDAARLLPDAPHLDLIGQYLVRYVYDSPDPRMPFVIGSREVNGDIHQTAGQTLATTIGGQCRGDCDDLSEFYQDLAERQGKLAHIVSMPAHAALAWAEQRDDGWHAFVLQTGPALEFVHTELGTALGMAYQHFDATDIYDPDAVGLLLRFSGENTRSSWRLSSRIFTDRHYAETMIDVQRDWHFQTYLQGIQKMEALVAEGDEDNANYRELAGLFAFTGQYAKAAEYLIKARDMTPEPTNKLTLDVEIANHLLDGGDEAGGREVILDILDRQLPELRQQLGLGSLQLSVQLASICLAAEQAELGARVLWENAGALTTRFIAELDAVKQQVGADQWALSGQIQMLRRIARMVCGTAAGLVQVAGKEAVATDENLRQLQLLVTTWVDRVAFWDTDDASDIPQRLAVLAHLLEVEMGSEALLAALRESEAPTKERDWKKRRPGDQAQDLAWIAVSVPFWAGRLGELFERRRDQAPDPDLVRAYAERLDAAFSFQRQWDMIGQATENQYHIGRLMVALVLEDETALRALLHTVQERNDKRLRDDTAQTLGDCARFLDQAWFTKVLQVWQDEVDYKPKYYWIAWRAALSGGTEQALMTAALAAERFADDPAFVEEHAFMKRLFATP